MDWLLEKEKIKGNAEISSQIHTTIKQKSERGLFKSSNPVPGYQTPMY